jgi:hypothetical protein
LNPIVPGCSEPSTIVIDNKEPNAPLVGSTSPTDDGDLLSLEPEQVTPELLADVPTVKAAREAFKKRLRDGALARSLGAGTICTHGKIRSLLPEVLSIKRVSAVRPSGTARSFRRRLRLTLSLLICASIPDGRRPARPPRLHSRARGRAHLARNSLSGVHARILPRCDLVLVRSAEV